MDDEQQGLFVIAITLLSVYVFLIYLCSTWLQKRYHWSKTTWGWVFGIWIFFLLLPIINIFAVLAILGVAIAALWIGPPTNESN